MKDVIKVIFLFSCLLLYNTTAGLDYGESCSSADACYGDLVCTNGKCECSDSTFFIGSNHCANKIFEGGLCSSGNDAMCLGQLKCLNFFCSCAVGKISDGNNNCLDASKNQTGVLSSAATSSTGPSSAVSVASTASTVSAAQSSTILSSVASAASTASVASEASTASAALSSTVPSIAASTASTTSTTLINVSSNLIGSPTQAVQTVASTKSPPAANSTLLPTQPVISQAVTSATSNSTDVPKISPSAGSISTNPPTSATTSSVTTPSTVTGIFTTAAATSNKTGYQKCPFNPCFNAGICYIDGDDYFCDCPSEYSGVICENVVTTVAPSPCSSSISPCLNGGTCVPLGSGYRCDCEANYTGYVCQQEVTTLSPTTTTLEQSTTKMTTSTTSMTTSTTAPVNCTGLTFDKNHFGCDPAEVVFMIEYAQSDSTQSVDHEGDFIKELIKKWRVDTNHIRVGVVVYHNRVHEAINIDEARSKNELKSRISGLTRILTPSGDANLTLALDYVKEHSFVKARPGVPRVVIPIIHQMSSVGHDQIPMAGDRLKSDCTSIWAFGIQGRDLDLPTIQQTVTQPWKNYLNVYSSFDNLEDAADEGLYHNLHCH